MHTKMASLTVDREDAVTIVWMHHGDDNRFHPDLLQGLERVLDDIESSKGPATLVLTGSGKFFSNGLDLDYMAAAPDRADVTLDRVHALLGRVLGLCVPTVAAVNGHAFAAGMMLALACDTAVMRKDRGYLCLPEADLGLSFSPGMNALLTSRLDPSTAHAAMVTARRFAGPDALAAGMVAEVAAEQDIMARAVALAASLAGKPRESLAAIKRDLYGPALDADRKSVV